MYYSKDDRWIFPKIWDNNIGSHHHVGVAWTSHAGHVAWQDTRNADPEAQSEDVYMAKLPLGEPTGQVTAESGGSPLFWSLGGAGVTLAVGGVLLLAGIRSMQSRPAPQQARSKQST